MEAAQLQLNMGCQNMLEWALFSQTNANGDIGKLIDPDPTSGCFYRLPLVPGWISERTSMPSTLLLTRHFEIDRYDKLAAKSAIRRSNRNAALQTSREANVDPNAWNWPAWRKCLVSFSRRSLHPTFCRDLSSRLRSSSRRRPSFGQKLRGRGRNQHRADRK